MTSVSRELGAEQDAGAFGETVARRFAAVFEREPVDAERAELGLALGAGRTNAEGLEAPVGTLRGER